MLNDLEGFIRRHRLIEPGDRVICAVSGGADSMALLMGMFLLREKMGIILEAAHFNHCLRGDESDEDETFVMNFCSRMEIPLHCAREVVVPGKKGLEAAARDARYAFFKTLPGKIATAHTADDNAETVLMHLVRGTGLKGLGGIAPIRENILRPMLGITRQQVLSFLNEYHVCYRTDSSNLEDSFLRNRLRHHVMPLLVRENPRIAENLSAMALRLRDDEAALQSCACLKYPLNVSELRTLPKAVRCRVLERFLKDSGVREPEAQHLELVDSLVYSMRPSARANFPGNITVYREYDLLLCEAPAAAPVECNLVCPGTVEFGDYTVSCVPATEITNTDTVFTVSVQGVLRIRSRLAGDALRLSGGQKSVKKLFIDRKVPAHLRAQIPVVSDDAGVVAVYGIGTDFDHKASNLPAWQISITTKKEKHHAG